MRRSKISKAFMKHVDFPEPVKVLIGELKRLPGVGPRSAERIAVWILQSSKAKPTKFTVGYFFGFTAITAYWLEILGSPVTNKSKSSAFLCLVKVPRSASP